MAAPAAQDEIIACLSDPAAFGAVDPVQRIDTHISALFLVGDRAYKLKRAVRLPFLDFSTLAAREAACRAELAVNRRTAPGLYLGVEAVRRGADGRLGLGGTGAVVDWLVVMRRFDQEGLFDRLAPAGAIPREEAEALAETIAAFHEAAPPLPGWGGAAGLAHTLETNHACFLDHAAEGTFDRAAAEALTAKSRAVLATQAALLDRRRDQGLVRQCHGDLHLGNICRFEGRPLLFDAIEFNDDFACIDVLYDLAFLLMDLWARGLRELASLIFNRYLECRPDVEGLAALPLMLSMRAAIRAHVAAQMARGAGDGAQALRARAREYFALAEGFLAPAPPRLLAVGGFSGCGKSRLARDLAPLLGAAPGAVVLRTDVIRKRLAGVEALTRLPPEGYSAEMSARTYAEQAALAGRALAAGQAVVADAVFAQPAQRAGIEAAARAAGVSFDGLWLEAAPEVMRARIQGRKRNASDATLSVLEKQLAAGPGPVTWMRQDSSGSKSETFRNALGKLGLSVPAAQGHNESG